MCRLCRLVRPGVARWVPALVVLGVAGVAVGLLLPAVLRTNYLATRMQCAGHMKQLIVGLHFYADAHPRKGSKGEDERMFPAGTIAHPALPPEQRLSWMADLLPYVEQETVYRRLDRTSGWDTAVNATAIRTSLRYYRCPRVYATDADVNVTSYLGMAGVGADAATLPAGDPRAGVFGYDRRTALADIKDGLANTIVMLESTRDNGPWAQGGPATVRGLDPADAPYLGVGRPFGGTHPAGPFGPGSRQTVGSYAAMGDGSVRLLKEDAIDPAVLQALATIAGKEELPADW